MARRYGCFCGAGGRGFKFRVSQAAGRPSPFRPAVLLRDKRLELKRGDFSAALNLSSGAGELSAAPHEQCLDAFLRALLSSLLQRQGGFMLHSAGVVKGGRAYLFLGKSGAGKSTLAKIAAGAGLEVISDEINLLRPRGKGFRVYGSPFWGEMRCEGRPGSWPLGGIYLLEKAGANRLVPCGKSEALKLLLRCLLNFEKGPDISALVLNNAAALLGGTSFTRLEFSKRDASFLRLI
ncbi:MAG: hypothetical protein AB7V08_04135 [Elusimicrobiales bacterium]